MKNATPLARWCAIGACVLPLLAATIPVKAQVADARHAARPTMAVAVISAAQTAPPTGAQKQLDDILSKPAYHRWERRFAKAGPQRAWMKTGPVPRWLSDALHNVGDWLGRKLFSHDDETRTNRTALSDKGWLTLGLVLKIVFWAVLAAVVLLIGWFAIRALLDAKRRPARVKIRPTAEKIRAALSEGAALALAGEEWLAEADQLAGDGDFRAAYRALYLALLSGLHDAGAIHFRRNRTNWTYVREFRGEAAKRGAFENLTGLFDEVWYGLSTPANAETRLPALQAEVAGLIRSNPREGARA